MVHDHHPTTYRAATRCCPLATEAYRLYRKRLREGRQPAVYVPCLGTARRLQALMCIGWSSIALAKRLRLSRDRVAQLTSNIDGNVHHLTAAKVASLYRQVSTIPGGEKRTITAATKRGFAPPAAWDNIDDPAETPKIRHPRHDGNGRVLIRRVLAGNANINILTLAEQAALWCQWEEQQSSEGRGCRPGLFAKQFAVGEVRAARLREASRHHDNTNAAPRRTNERQVA